ncbi:MAG: hypothetical protein JWM91_361 [Rhodospirillales bacterium]|nr:hypothetical protein [Rhodospirillales bacterium]
MLGAKAPPDGIADRGDMAQFCNRMTAHGYPALTIVRRANLVGVARFECGINIPKNPADAKQCARPKDTGRQAQPRLRWSAV